MKKYPLSYFSGNFDVYPLEIDGPTAISSPRQIVSAITASSTFRFGGYLLYRMVPGFTFTVGKSANGTLDGVYTVVSSSLTTGGLEDVKTPVVAATTASVITSGPVTIDTVPVIAGDRVLLMGQPDPAHNGIYVVAAGAWTRATDFDSQVEINTSAVYVLYGMNYGETVWKTTTPPVFTLDTTPIVFTQHIGNIYTDVIVVEPVPTPTGSLGSITYAIPAHTSLNLFGNSAFDIGTMVNQNIVSMLETFAGPTSPPNPLIGQQWYNTTSETFQRYVASYGPGWTADIDLDAFQLKFKDVENGNTDIVIAAADGETGLSVKCLTDPPAGQSIFRVLSSGGTERLDVQHDGYIASANSLLITGTTLANVLRGKLIVSTSKTSTTYSVDVDGNVNIDTGDIQLDNQYGIVSGSGKFIKSDATGETWQMTGSFAVNTNDLFVNETNGRVGINTITPTEGLDVNTTAHIAGVTAIDGATTIHNTLTVDNDLIVDTTANVLHVDVSSGFVGINKVPTVPLDVVGNTNIAGEAAITGDLHVDTDVLAVDTTNNRVGINTATPSTALHVVGNTILSDSLTVDGTTLVVDSTNNRIGINKAVPTVPLDVVGNTNIAGTTNITSGNFIVDTNVLVVDSTNNFVGVNVLPTFPLDVNGATNIVGDLTVTGILDVTGANITFTGDILLDGNVDVTGDFIVDTTANTLYVDVASGFVGINTVPTTHLDVNGGVHVTGVVNLDNQLLVDGDVLVVDVVNNRIGINKAIPTVPLDVVGDTNIAGTTNITAGDFTVDTDVLIVDATNNYVGVNTAVPAFSLDVTGDVQLTGNVGVGATPTTDALTVNGDVALTAATPVIKFPDGNFAYGEDTTAPADGDTLQYVAANSRWENRVPVSPTKAWAIVTGATGAIVNDFGVTSVTRSGTGVYDVVLGTTFTTANDYVVNLSVHTTSPAHISYAGNTTTGFTVYTFSATSNLAADVNFTLHVVGTV